MHVYTIVYCVIKSVVDGKKLQCLFSTCSIRIRLPSKLYFTLKLIYQN